MTRELLYQGPNQKYILVYIYGSGKASRSRLAGALFTAAHLFTFPNTSITRLRKKVSKNHGTDTS